MGFKIKGDIQGYIDALTPEMIQEDIAKYNMAIEEESEEIGTLRAIYTRDAIYDEIPVFKFNPKTGMFENGELFYHFAIVMNDVGWLVYVTNGDLIYPIENLERVPEKDIFKLIDDK